MKTIGVIFLLVCAFSVKAHNIHVTTASASSSTGYRHSSHSDSNSNSHEDFVHSHSHEDHRPHYSHEYYGSSSQCPGANEEYVGCKVCENTCAKPLDTLTCTLGTGVPCPSGCVCKIGYLRDVNDKCIPYTSCPAPLCTDATKQYYPCLKAPRTCSNVAIPPPSAACKPACDCKSGTYEITNALGVTSCVPVSTCPCPANSVLVELRNSGCLNWQCVCKNGYIRDLEGLCVPKNELCPSQFEVYSSCAPPPNCEVTCLLTPPTGDCSCVSRCICKPGYIRATKTSKCDLPSKCSCPITAVTGTDVEFSLTASLCPNYCISGVTPTPTAYSCGLVGPGCKCKPGKYFTAIVNGLPNGPCIPCP